MSAGTCYLNGTLSIETRGAGFYAVGAELQRFLQRESAGSGLLSVFCTHTSASLCVQENADPSVLTDLSAALKGLAPEGALYRHRGEVCIAGERIVLLHGFIKKARKTPKPDIDTAVKRMKDLPK